LNSGVSNDLEGIYFFNALDGYVMGTEGLLLKTADGGITWNQEQSGTTSFLRDAFFFNREEGFICGHDGIILKKGNCLPDADFFFEIDSLTVNFIDHSTSATSYLWNFGDGTTSADKDPMHTYASSGDYNVCLRVQNECGTDSVCKTITIDCPDPVSRFVYDVSLLKVYFYDSSNTAFTPSYLWDFGDSAYSTLKNPSHQYSDPGIYRVCLTVTDICSTDVSCQDMELLLPYKLNILILPSKINDRLVQFADETPGNNQWTWDFGDGEKSSLRDPSHQYKDYGTYQVCLTAGNQQNHGILCDTLLLKVNPALHEENPVIIYPNPTQGNLFIRFFREFSSVNIIIQDLTGRSILEKQLNAIDLYSPSRLDLSQLQKGIYFISVKAEGYEKSWKIIIY
jgi:PKD repeat protein